MPKHPAGDRRVEPERLQGRDDPVPSEHGAEPGDARVRIWPFGEVRHQHVEIGDAAAGGFVEDLVGGIDRRRARGRRAQGAPRIAERDEERPGRIARSSLVAAVDLDEQRASFARGEIEAEDGALGRQMRRRGIESNRRRSAPVVEPGIAQRHMTGADFSRMGLSPSRSLGSTHLEEIGEIGGEGDRQFHPARLVVEIADVQPLEAAGVPEKSRPSEVDQVMFEPGTARRADEIGIGQIASQRSVVVAQGGAEQNRPRAIERNDQQGKMAGVAVIKALSGPPARRGVAVAIEYGEGIAVLQDQRAQVLDRRRGADCERLTRRRFDDFRLLGAGRPLRLLTVRLHVHLRLGFGQTRG